MSEGLLGDCSAGWSSREVFGSDVSESTRV